MSQQNPEVVTPIDVGVALPHTSNQDAEAAGRFVYDKPTPENSVMLF